MAIRCADQLAAAGYTYQSGNDREIIRTYASVKHRRIQPRRRMVHKAPYSVPAHRATGEQQLLAKVAAGGDLWPHQSRKIENVDVEDGMLNDYGIQHFHLGTTPDPKHPNLIQGTKELLFAVVKNDDFYALGIFDPWSKQALLDIIQANWPNVIEPYVLQDSAHMKVRGLRRNFTDEEEAILRKAGVNVITHGADGSLRMGPGGGVTFGGKSLSATSDLIKLEDSVKVLQEDVIDNMTRKGASRDAEVR
ncbi:MAG: hypothetical protein WCC90_12555, partial [Methylocella sp.]